MKMVQRTGAFVSAWITATTHNAGSFDKLAERMQTLMAV